MLDWQEMLICLLSNSLPVVKHSGLTELTSAQAYKLLISNHIQSKITLDRRELYSSYLCEMIKPWTGWNFIVPACVR